MICPLQPQCPENFPQMQGIRVERLVLLATQELDKNYSQHVEFSSGLLLFRTVLFQFAFANSAEDLIRAVAENVPAPCRGDAWRLDRATFEKWKSNSAFVLAAIHELRETPVSLVSAVEFQAAMNCNLATASGHLLQIDSLNRICFVK